MIPSREILVGFGVSDTGVAPKRDGGAAQGHVSANMGPGFYSKTMVARPRKIRNPKKSVVAVTNTADETPGSNFSFDRVKGVSTPIQAATSRFRIMAAPMTGPIRQSSSRNQNPAATPIRGARTSPLA